MVLYLGAVAVLGGSEYLSVEVDSAAIRCGIGGAAMVVYAEVVAVVCGG